MLSPEQIKQLMPLLAKNFIQRRDPVAQQTRDGGYRPLRDSHGTPSVIFDRDTLTQHLSGTNTYGHYMLDKDDKCKLFVFDIDLTKTGLVPTIELAPDATEEQYESWVASFVRVPDLRDVWHSRSKKDAPARAYIKMQLRTLGQMFASSIYTLLEIPTAVAYTGNKGIHVYGFTGPVLAGEARDGADLVMASLPYMKASRGDNFFADDRRDDRGEEFNPSTELFDPFVFHNFHVEVFPKQRSLEGKDLGNLVRLPLGKNLHSPADPTFFVDLTKPLNELSPVDPVYALTTKNPWQTQEEASTALS